MKTEFRVLVSLKMSFKILMISIYLVSRRVAWCRHFTCDSIQHYSLYIWIIASIRLRHLDGDLQGRDEISILTLFIYIFIEHDIVKFTPTYKNLIYRFQLNVFIKLTVYQIIVF